MLLLATAASAQQMVRVPGGPFTMGSDDGPADEQPAHTVTLEPFEIDRVPVQNGEFALFLTRYGPVAPDGRRYFDWDGREATDPSPEVRATRGGGHDSTAQEIRTAERGRTLSRAPRAGHHNIGFRCAR